MSVHSPRWSILLYADVNLNVIDGSAIWVQSAAHAFAGTGAAVDLLLKHPVDRNVITSNLERVPTTRLIEPHSQRAGKDGGLTPEEAASMVVELERKRHYDAIVIRGLKASLCLAAHQELHGRLWSYLTDIPQRLPDLTNSIRRKLEAIANASRYLLCQTEELRSFLEVAVPGAAGRAVLFPPITPDTDLQRSGDPPYGGLKIFYAGKFAPEWNTLEMTELPSRLGALGFDVEFHVLGDKIHNHAKDPSYAERMREALSSAPGVVWHRGRPRDEVLDIGARCDLGMSWRSPKLDTSLELSTKVLEYGAIGLPVVLNQTPMHADLLGESYPYFVRTLDDVVDTLIRAATVPEEYRTARRMAQQACESFTVDRAIERVKDYLSRSRPRVSSTNRSRPTRVVVAGHDLKFAWPIITFLRSLPHLDVRVDEWRQLGEHDETSSAALAQWGDVIICEWCGPNAAWYSERKKAGQRLIVRLHRFELYRRYPRRVAIENVDQVVCVSEHYADLTAASLGWPTKKVVTIPNAVDFAVFDRAKIAGARFTLGVAGFVPRLKRLDRAFDVIERLRQDDERFVLSVKGKMPWEYEWVWRQEDERRYYQELFRRAERTPALQDGIVFEGFGADMGNWLRRVGHVLSLSDIESFHLAAMEGMASGAVPAMAAWPGVTTVYPEECVYGSTDELSDTVRDLSVGCEWEQASHSAKKHAARYDTLRVFRSWETILRHDLDSTASLSPGPEVLAHVAKLRSS